MIIVSKFHDFYDHGMGLAGYSTDDIRFVRQREEVDDAQKRFGRAVRARYRKKYVENFERFFDGSDCYRYKEITYCAPLVSRPK